MNIIVGASSLNPNDGFVMYRNANGTLVQATKAQVQAFLNGDITFDDLTLTGTLTVGGISSFASGTVGAPGITFTGDTDTGFYRIGSDNIGISLGGTKYVDITSSLFTLSNSLSQRKENVALAGNSQGTATQIIGDCVNLTGADGTKGAILPVTSTGRVLVVTNSDNTNAAKLYPGTAGKINRGTANAAIVIPANMSFLIFGDMEATTDWSTVGYVSTGSGSGDVTTNVPIDAQFCTLGVTNVSLGPNETGNYINVTSNSYIATTSKFRLTLNEASGTVIANIQNVIATAVTISLYNTDPNTTVTTGITIYLEVLNY